MQEKKGAEREPVMKKCVKLLFDVEDAQKVLETFIAKNAEKYGGAITQDVDEEGNLVGVGVVTQEKIFGENETISVADIRNELFEGENIVTGETDHGRSELISGPFVESNK